jgi:ATP-dependent Clp protease ATP-binding subunit ClpA
VFSRFSPAARRVLRAAEQECRNHNHYYVGAEHLLEALLAEHDRAILAALDTQSIDSREVHAEVRRSLGTGEDRVWEGILLTPRVRKIVAVAEAGAGDREIEPLDLFEALRAEGGSLAAEILRRAAAPRNPAAATE